MSRARHNTKKTVHRHTDGKFKKHKADGGPLVAPNPNVLKEATAKTIGTIHGGKAKKRGDRRGSAVGSDLSPFTSAHKHGGKVHRAHGGKVHSDEAEDKAMMRKMVKPSAMKKGDGGSISHSAKAVKARSLHC